jgi:phage terminase large subunit GpA-like protein
MIGNSNHVEVLRDFYFGLQPIKTLKVSEWAAKNRYLSSVSAARPGLWRNERTPYLVEPMDCMSPLSPVTQIDIQKGVQLGFTEMLLNVFGCYIDNNPCPMMYVGPTVEVVKKLSKSRVDSMIENCPALYKKIKPARSRDSGNTIMSKEFPGGIFVLSGGNSAASLRSQPIMVAGKDEVDSYPQNVDEEGDPSALVDKRTSTFGDLRKIMNVSTPTLEDTSRIAKYYNDTDQRMYFVPCPFCGHMQVLDFQFLKWEPNKPETAKYQCCECGEMIEERRKQQMLLAGEWRPTKPENIKITRRGYFINSLYSPYGWLSWQTIAEEWIASQQDVNKLRVFVNTILGETWKEKGEAPEWENIYNRREDYKLNTINNDVAVITAGADVQKDRIEVEIVGWCKGKRTYSVDYRVLMGDTSNIDDPVWNALAAIVGETWKRPDGLILPMRMMAVDSGNFTTTVYQFCRRFDITRVFPVKGQDKQAVILSRPKKVDINLHGKSVGNVHLVNVGVSIIKSELYGLLRLNRIEDNTPPGYCHFPQYGPDYFKGLTAERLEFKMKNGNRIYQWVKKFERNEPLDCRVYNRAAAAMVGIDRWEDHHYDAVLSEYTREDEKPKQQSQPNKNFKSIWNR